MNARRLSVAMSVLVIVVLMVSACASAATPAPRQADIAAAPAQLAQPKPAEAAAPPAAGSNAGGVTTAIKNPSSTSPYQANRLIIKNGEMNLTVLNADRAIDQVTSIAVESGGYIVNAKTWVQDGYKHATIALGMPSDQFEVVQRQLRALAVQVPIDTASGQDVSDEYVDLQSRLTNLEATSARIREFLDKATTVEESLKVNAQLTEIEGEIEQVKGRLQYLKDRAAYSTILVNIEQQRPTPTPYPTATPAYWQPGETLSQAGDVLAQVLRVLIDLLIWLAVVAAPLVIPVAIVALVVQRLRKKK